MNRRLLWWYVSVGLVVQACGSEHAPATKSSAERKSDVRETSSKQSMVAASGAAGAISLPPLGTLPSIECDVQSASDTKCGDQTCPDLPENAAASCTVTCCTDSGKCGVRSAAIVSGLALPHVCVETALPDSRCPSGDVGAMTFPGCCDSIGHCGRLVGTLCLSSGTGAEPKCDQGAP